MLRLAAFLFLSLMAGSQAPAQDLATGGGQIYLADLTANDRTIEGQLDACELTYAIVFEDYIYRNGGAVILRGSVLMSAMRDHPDKEPGIILKVTAFDLAGTDPRLAPINYAFLSAGNLSSAGQEYGKFTCEDGGFCAGYGLFKSTDLMEVILSGRFAINFNRNPGSSDVKVPLDFLRDKPEGYLEFNECIQRLLPIIKEKISRR